MKKNVYKNNKKSFYAIRKDGVYLSLLIIFGFYLPLSKEKTIKLNFIEEIIITMIGPGSKLILNYEYNCPPNEIEINGNRFGYIPLPWGEKNYTYNLEDSNNNIIKLFYNSSPTTLENMFKDLVYIRKIDLSNFDASNVNDISSMFENCQKLENINFNNFKTSSVKSMSNMFKYCIKITTIDLSFLDTSSVIDMQNMFSYCYELSSLDLSNFKVNNADTSNMFENCCELKSIKFSHKWVLNNMSSMFYNCIKLTSLDLSNFDTSRVTQMQKLFYNCNALMSVDLSSFDTSLVQDFSNMFFSCRDLEALDLSHFKTDLATSMENMFSGTNSLIFLNIKSFHINNGISISGMLDNNESPEKLCYDENKASIINTNFDFYTNNCSDPCFSPSYKLHNILKKCIRDCSTDHFLKYEYNNKCYNDCPEGTFKSSTNQYLCLKAPICDKYYNINKTECFDELPEGYFISDPQQNIIDKCYDTCKRCYKKGNSFDNGCLTCNETFFLDNGNCLAQCTYGFYLDENQQKRCTCNYNPNCKECTLKNYNPYQYSIYSCISCKEGYYQKYEDIINNNIFVNCYNELSGYYLDNDNYYKKCYSSCAECSKAGNDSHHNCNKCKENYISQNRVKKNHNCYMKCNYYYYLNSENKYICTDSEECPAPYNKLIKDKKKCIDECSKDEEFIHEYNNSCFKNKIEQSTVPVVGIKTEEAEEKSNFPVSPITDMETEESVGKSTIPITDIKTEEIGVKSKIIKIDIETEEIAVKTKIIKIDIETEGTIEKTTIPIFDIKSSEASNSETGIISPISTSSKQNNSSNWSSQSFFSGNFDSETKITKDDIIKNLREDIINHNLDALITEVINEKEDKLITLKEYNALFQLTTSENQNNNEYKNISSIKLGDCENILKSKYNISDNDTLIILKIDYNLTGLLIPIIGYEVYHPIYNYK